ncbi:NAD-dependent DNA ligase LigA [bacterium]|nr:NAD-dependent DNA ligase LigA [bacterium]
MTKKEAKERIEKLKKLISYHRYLYHVLDRQEISPDALDSLKHELFLLEQKYPEFITPDSPTQRVAGKPLEGFKKVEHEVPMLSIEDIFSEEELFQWQDYLKRLVPEHPLEYFCELKIDGFAISLIYEKGVFVCGSTRGDGKTGEDVTQNLKTIESIPLRLEIHKECLKPEIKYLVEKIEKLIKEGKIEIRGEVYMEKKDFEKFNEERKKKGEPTYANPRNLAAGSIRQLDPKLAASRPLKFLAYDIVTDMGQKKHSQEHQILSLLGFKTDPGKICKNLSEVVDFWREVSKKRETLPFQIDGVVINVNDNALFQKLGVAGKSPRGVRAFKFSPKQATTKILDIRVQVGRTGAITPVAILKPVQVGGVTITRATLHNEDEIKRLGVKIGDTVIVERAGDVIPAVTKVLKELRTGKEKEFHFPRRCPICNTKLVRPPGEAVWRCPNPECQGRRKEFLYHFVSKKGFDIEGLGEKIIDQLIEENLISQAQDIFALKEGDLIPLERFAEKSARNLIEAIEKSKKIPLARFIYALGIRHVGEETAIDLANYFGSLDKLKKASKEELKAIPDIGEIVAESIYNWFQNKRNQKLIHDLIRAGIKILPPEKVGRKLKGLTFVITGTLESMSRAEAQKKIRLEGGHPANSVSKQTDYLIVGKKPGSKLEKAKKLGIKTISEKEFLKMIK